MKNLNKNQKITIIIIMVVLAIGFYYYKNLTNLNEIEITKENLTTNAIEDEKVEEKIKIHISGAVKQEGIVELESESRVSDAIEKAGGLKDNADLENINLAYRLEDGTKIYIPKLEDRNNAVSNTTEKSMESFNTSDSKQIETTSSTSGDKKININTATQTELELLPGIGKSTAQNIIQYRKENGKFKVVEDIKKVNGIGEGKYEKIKDLIVLK